MFSLPFSKKLLVMAAVLCACGSGTAGAQVSQCGGDIADSYTCECNLTFSQTYTGTYRHGQPYDCLTIAPDGSGETFAGRGITLRIRLKCERSGLYAVGVPAEEIVLFNPSLCICPGGNIADHPTDANGYTEFSGTIRGGGCANGLTLFVDGQPVRTFPIQINSTDPGRASRCFTDASDIAALAARLGRPERWDLCFDYNESGAPIDASDLAYFASVLGAACR